MTSALSARLAEIVDALPLRPGMRVLEIGCGPGAAARAVVHRIGRGFVLGIDRSERAIADAVRASRPELVSGWLAFRTASAEQFALEPGEAPFDLAFAVRVGALDGRHPDRGAKVLERLRQVLRPDARLYIDGGDPLREIKL